MRIAVASTCPELGYGGTTVESEAASGPKRRRRLRGIRGVRAAINAEGMGSAVKFSRYDAPVLARLCGIIAIIRKRRSWSNRYGPAVWAMVPGEPPRQRLSVPDA
jgi:hypothetical protein